MGNLLTKYQKFSLNKRKGRNLQFSKKNMIRMFLGTRRILCFTTEKLFARCPKMTEKGSFFKQFSSKYIYRDVNCSFFNPAEKTLPESQFFFLIKVQKRIENSNIFNFLRKYFSSNCPFGFVEHTFDSPIEINLTESQTFFAHVRRNKRNSRLFLKNCSVQTVPVNT